MKSVLFTGACTALVTPFLGDHVNYPMVNQLLRRQQEAGISAVVLGGTTGESPTLSDTEKQKLFEEARSFAENNMTLICGTGSNDTQHAVELSLAAEEAGADALLVVSPYYNKANPDGLTAHYLSIAHAVQIPIILYNVPGRTGLDMPVSVYQRLCHVPNIVGVKEASTDVVKVMRILNACGPEFSVWCGNDDQAVAAMALGAKGVISVLSNVMPLETQTMAQAALAGDFDTAAALQCSMLPLIDILFREVNPIPVKAAMEILGYDCGKCRLPLGQLSKENKAKLETLLKSL